LVELLASIAIIALLLVSAGIFVANYVSTARQRADQQTLQTLNDALTRYKTQGGGTSGFTLGAPIGNIINRLKQPVSWAGGLSHQVMNTGFTVAAQSLDATGSGSAYRFYRYNSYTDNSPSSGTATSSMPYGQGVGYAEFAGTITMTVNCSTAYWALKIGNAAPVIYVSSTGPTAVAGTSATFWSCVGASNSTPSGNITAVTITSTATAVNIKGLTSMNFFSISNNQLTSLDVAGCPALQNLYCDGNDLTSLNMRNCSALQSVYCMSNNLTSLNISNLSNLQNVYAGGNLLTSINASGSSALQFLRCDTNSLTSINLSGCTALQSLYCENNSLASLDISSTSVIVNLDCRNNQLSSITWGGAASLSSAKVYGNTNITGSTSALNTFYAALPEVSGGGTNTLYVSPTAPSATDTTATTKGWTVNRSSW
jgi:type II secretory pathway pseudopilin PulG